LKAIKKSQLKRVNVDTTVQEKFIRYPTDARLYDIARSRLVNMAKERDINLRQTYSRVSKKMFIMQGSVLPLRGRTLSSCTVDFLITNSILPIS